MAAAAYPEAVGDGEHDVGGMMAPAPLEPPPLLPLLLLLPGLEHFLDDFFSFIQGNSAGVAGACPAGHWGWGCCAPRCC